MGGAFNVMGQFLKGYMDAQQSKHQQKLQERAMSMDMANQWAKIADTTQNDAIREMATKNMEDSILQHEKVAGEKYGLGAVIKFLRKGKSDKNSPSFLGQVRSQMGMGQPPSETAEPAAKAQPTSVEAATSTPETVGPEVPPEGAWAKAQAAQESVGPTLPASPKQTPTGIMGAVPEGGLFPRLYSGGTRLSPTNEEIQSRKEQSMKRELEIKSKVEQENAENTARVQNKIHQENIDANVKRVQQSQAYLDSDETTRKRMEYQAITNTPYPQHTEMDFRPTGAPIYQGDQVYSETIGAGKQNITDQWRKANPIAASLLDVQSADKKDIRNSMKEAGEYEKSVREIEKKIKEANAYETRARGSYYEAMPAIERTKAEKTNDALEKTNQVNVYNTLKELDEKQWPAHLRAMFPELSMIGEESIDQLAEKYVTGMERDESGNVIQARDQSGKAIVPKKDENGRPFRTLEDYKNWWYTRQLGGIDVPTARNYVITGVNPWRGIIPSGKSTTETTRMPRNAPGATGPASATGVETKATPTGKTPSGRISALPQHQLPEPKNFDEVRKALGLPTQ